MVPIKGLCVLAVALLIAGCSAKLGARHRGGCDPSPNKSWDYFLLMQQWPGTECNISRCTPNADKYKYWTLHGLWPQRNDGTWPQCCPGPQFDPSRLSDLQQLLMQYWPSFEHGGDPNSFWSHEWQKHGTCAASDHSCCTTEHDYFASALGLVKQINIESAFESANVKWGNQYTTEYLTEALVKAYSVKPMLGCTRSGLLHTVAYCFDKNLTAFDCPSSNEACRLSTLVIPYPPRV